jgi:UDP-glucose:(heptosyl)LPS alpha-1,3-glucosyltransferase
VIHCAVDVERYAPERQTDARRTLRAHWSAGDATVWLFAGSGWRRKGLDIAISALARVADATTQLWVAGRDDPRRWRRLARREGVAGRVQFLGERGDLERYYAAVDGLLLPTRYDAFGLVCLEAAAAGLPVVTNRRAGAAELFESCGRVVPGSSDAIAYAAVMDELAQPEARAELGAKARKMARMHDWSGHVTRLRTLYQSVTR